MGFDVSVSPVGVVQASISGSLLTLAPLGVGTATVTLEVTAGEVSALHQFPATVVPAPPSALGSIAALTLAGRETHTVTASDYFAGEGVTYAAESSDPGVATVAVDGAVVTVTAVAAGSATIKVTATNEGGKAEQSFVVTIQLPAVTLTLGGAAREIELADYFGDEVTGYEVTVSPSGIVHVSRSGSQLTLTAVAAGSATVTVTATNAVGSAEQSFAVTVVPLAPAAVGSIAAATLTEGATHMVTASDYFEGEGAHVHGGVLGRRRRDGGGGWRGGDRDGGRPGQRDGDGDGDERGRECRAELRRHGPTPTRHADPRWRRAGHRALGALRRCGNGL